MNRNRFRLRCAPTSHLRNSHTVWREAGAVPQPPGLNHANLVYLPALVTVTLFLAGTLGTSWFAVLEALQNADYVLSTCDTAQPQRADDRIVNSSRGVANYSKYR